MQKYRLLGGLRDRFLSAYKNEPGNCFKEICDDRRSYLALVNMKSQISGDSGGTREICETTIKCCDKRISVKLRNNTSDIFILKEIFVDKCYDLPASVDAHAGTIVDIGANIGLASLFLSAHYPEACIFSFEPVEENYQILKQNASANGRIRPFRMAISDRVGEASFKPSGEEANFGGGYLEEGGEIKVPCTTLPVFCDEMGIDRINVLKLDCEGGEYPIIYGLDEKFMDRIDSIVGELHGDEAFALLVYLNKYFEISVHKELDQPLFTFTAVNRQYLAGHNTPHQVGRL